MESIEAKPTSRGVTFAVTASNSVDLIGQHGETLDALTHLLRRILESRFSEDAARDVSLDVNLSRQLQLTMMTYQKNSILPRNPTYFWKVNM